MNITFGFHSTFFMFGMAYLPGFAVVFHFACFTVRFGGPQAEEIAEDGNAL